MQSAVIHNIQKKWKELVTTIIDLQRNIQQHNKEEQNTVKGHVHLGFWIHESAQVNIKKSTAFQE